MKTLKQLIYIFSLAMLASISTAQHPTTEIRNDLKTFYDSFLVTGSFILYDQLHDKYIIYNQAQTTQPFSPSSTFKICNSLIGLETGVIKDENFIINWDGIKRQNPKWNSNHDLKTAFKNSTVWYYQELARRVGPQQMKYRLDQVNYGNKDTSGGIDRFWLTGGLRISPMQQIDFLKRLHHNQLPFAPRTIDIVKKIMITKETKDFVIRAKTGWGYQDNQDIGWYVGYIETKDNVYYFAQCIQSADPNNQKFAAARLDITYAILNLLHITKK